MTFLGKKLGGALLEITLTYNGYKGKSSRWTWSTKNLTHNSTIKPGIYLYDGGPYVDSLDSPYLVYKTLLENDKGDIEPTVDMLVSITRIEKYPHDTFCYVITKVDGNSMVLEYIREANSAREYDIEKLLPKLTPLVARRIDGNLWSTDKLGDVIIYIGSWSSYESLSY